jgi:redox-sensitive bicupin YhaK (pirin superfamily)
MGEVGGVASPAVAYTPLVGADVELDPGADARLPLEPDFEHAVLAMSGDVAVDGVDLPVGSLLYLGCRRSELAISSRAGARLLLLGGEPFEEHLVMWWNFIGRSHDEIVADREEWMSGTRFGVVHGYGGERLPAPPMPTTTLKPRGRVR